MHSSPDATAQVQYWDRVPNEKRFSHPLRMEWLARYVVPQARVLDVGCGYGRTLAQLLCAGYKNVIGIDFSFGMLTRCRSEFPGLRLIQNSGQAIPLRRHSADLVLLFAVLTCIPRDEDQLAVLHEIRRVLRPGGLIYISDFPLNDDARNRERYERFAQECGVYGAFELPEGVSMRHHRKEWIEELIDSFKQLEYATFVVTTMNGNRSAAFQYLGQAPG